MIKRPPNSVLATAAVVVVAIPMVTPDSWLPEDSLTHDLVLAAIMLGTLVAIAVAWIVLGKESKSE